MTTRRMTTRRMTTHRMTTHRMTTHRMTTHRITYHLGTTAGSVPACDIGYAYRIPPARASPSP
ncbi:MAG: hypothetical protein NTV17_12855 [Burkholderiales bacterium]|nr:hypothetical protein [Burkholderiales bacterium]